MSDYLVNLVEKYQAEDVQRLNDRLDFFKSLASIDEVIETRPLKVAARMKKFIPISATLDMTTVARLQRGYSTECTKSNRAGVLTT